LRAHLDSQEKCLKAILDEYEKELRTLDQIEYRLEERSTRNSDPPEKRLKLSLSTEEFLLKNPAKDRIEELNKRYDDAEKTVICFNLEI
jgi:hypothetical protein